MSVIDIHEKASCSRCANRTDEKPPFCTWLNAEIPVGVADDPECEGFSLKGNLRASCPKTPDQNLIQTALKLKGFRGSVVMERICCGKPGCHCQSGALHGPYPYLHYYSDGKVKRRYLTKTVSALLNHSREELKKMLHATEAVLGQEGTMREGPQELMQRSGFLACANGEHEKSPGQLTREEFDDDRIAKVTRLDPPEDGAECCRCKQRKILCWYVEDFDGSRGHVCQDCGGILLEKLRRRGEVES
jgi:hypothetical protein